MYSSRYRFARVGEVADQRDQVPHAHVCLGLLEVAGCRFGYGDGLEEAPQEPDVQAMLGQPNGTVVQFLGRESVELLVAGHRQPAYVRGPQTGNEPPPDIPSDPGFATSL